ncbi:MULTISPECIES: heat shock protein transcriptional repressor HspR [Corynebacterium]|uniref:Helix-turn-helix transcriptional regulator n=1 Tax=Corynebacterium lipophilum TaxID=2804918 RepID=A0AAW5HYF0_9CORY|nr:MULTISPECIES: helix-turn-helix transcriptional regulator [Corynebacterium]MCO6394895.1 helix-turn-helix transcriptional regulator [Corynebacterium lipophilum]MCZ2117580.1 helix-turn-helix transcriptional regulator [Corynebacterium lipophilum]MDK8244892.1 helix-turn-helix transcriptional regulator [Corynebacterium sp. UMB10321]OFT28113.1 MerR family transcriptional regulator [Corynebacterium sp. HMSC08D02]OIR43803.1 MerR family transcriptional regulator [Corynebacterium sp. NML120713]
MAEEYYVISVAAELTGMHAQTLRTYDRIGLVTPMRTSGGGRRYSRRDISMLRRIQQLSQEDGVNLAGIKTIIELTEHIDELQEELAAKREENAQLRQRLERQRLETRPRGGELVHVPRSTALVTWEPSSARSRRRAR